jgi:hypothetical protein
MGVGSVQGILKGSSEENDQRFIKMLEAFREDFFAYRFNQTEPLVSFFSSVEDFEHGFDPYPAFGPVALQGQRGGGVFNLFIPLAFASGN